MKYWVRHNAYTSKYDIGVSNTVLFSTLNNSSFDLSIARLAAAALNDIDADGNIISNDIDALISKLEPKLPISFDNFLPFAKSKNPNDTYIYISTGNCPIAQYLKDNGITTPNIDGQGNWEELYNPKIKGTTPIEINKAVMQEPHTWGELVNRLENIIVNIAIKNIEIS